MLEANWLDEVLESLNEERVTPCHSVSLQEKQPSDKIADPETRMDKGSGNSVTLVTPVTPKNDKFEKRLTDIEETKLEQQREERRKRVLKILDVRPDSQRVFITNSEDHKNVLVTIAIRNVATFEMLVCKSRFDPFVFLELIERGGVQ